MDSLNKIVDYVSTAATYAGLQSSPSLDESEHSYDESNNDANLAPMNEDLTTPEEILSMTDIPELEDAVKKCKDLILSISENSDKKKLLTRRLIELRWRLHDVTEALKDEGAVAENSLKDRTVVLGHHFKRQSHPKSLATYYCDRCSGVIWDAIHAWHLCTDCDYKCHLWCLNQVCRVCAHVVTSETPSYIEYICPEPPDGLAAQNYRCAECLNRTSFSISILEPRRCDYNGKYYCPTCHWNSTAVIPARVILNWDFSEKRVSRVSKQILKLLGKIPILKLEKLNPVLFASVDELIAVKVLRQRLLTMKKYLTSCKVAVESNITWQLKDRLHFLESEETYSLDDLIDLRGGTLLPHLKKLIGVFHKHITVDCKICHGKGFFCEYCDVQLVIFPFESDIESCKICGATYHLPCWIQHQQKCMKCERRQKRLSECVTSDDNLS